LDVEAAVVAIQVEEISHPRNMALLEESQNIV
jgi:hypothetical protein